MNGNQYEWLYMYVCNYSRLHDEVREMEEENSLEEHVDKDAQYNAQLEELAEVKRKRMCVWSLRN